MSRTVCMWLLVVAATPPTRAQEISAWWDVTIDQGTVRGYRSADGGSYYFLGIPYATAPTGPHRFQAPLAAPPWEGILESRYEDILCPQMEIGEQQCLVLNVFAPTRARAEPTAKPVLVYVHGGAYNFGSGPTYGAGNLLERGVIVVTFNYRLGALGFLCLGTERAPGNAAMKDQVAALRWVRRNIANFGGDPEAVTVYGTSAGAASVDLLILSNKTNGLFQRAIMESGSALLPWSVDRDPIQTAINVATSMGFGGAENLTQLTDFYKRTPARALAAATDRYYNSLTDATFGFAPCLETPSETAFLTEDPASILEKGNYEAVPILIAYCDMEGFFRASAFYEQGWKERMESNFSAFLPGDLQFDGDEKSQVAETVKTFYFGSEEVSEETVESYLHYFGDITFFYGIRRSALLHAASSQPVYLMEFSYEGLLNQDKRYFSYVHGAGHADINRYIFRDFRPNQINDYTALELATTFWSTFTKKGAPTLAGHALIPVTWTPLQQNVTSYLSFGLQLRMRTAPLGGGERVQLWDDIYRRHYRPITTVHYQDLY